MATLHSRGLRRLHPLHAILLGFPIALFTSALLADISYLNSAEIQWTNFASWLIAGGLIFGALVILWAAVGLIRRSSSLVYFLLLLVMWVSGLVNAFQHSRDGWSSVGQFGLILSLISTICALAAGWIAFRAQAAEAHFYDRGQGGRP